MARLDGPNSFYCVYSKPDFYDVSFNDPAMADTVVVDTQTQVPLNFTARSAQGWNNVGISVFEHQYYCGTGITYVNSTPDITNSFPTGSAQGASSIIVMKGVWSLHTEKNYHGVQVSIDGQNEFGPGTRIQFLQAANDKVKSIQYIREN